MLSLILMYVNANTTCMLMLAVAVSLMLMYANLANVCEMNEFNVKEDTEKFLPHVKLKAHFHDKEQPSDELQRDEFESLKPKMSNWTPPDGQFTSVDLFVKKKCRINIQKLNFNKSLKF